MTTFRVTKAKKANGFTLGSLQRNLEGVFEVELESSPTLKRIYEIVEEELAEALLILGEYLGIKSSHSFSVSRSWKVQRGEPSGAQHGPRAKDTHTYAPYTPVRAPPKSPSSTIPTKPRNVSPQNAIVSPSTRGYDMSLKVYGGVHMSLKVKGVQWIGRADYVIGTSGKMLETLVSLLFVLLALFREHRF